VQVLPTADPERSLVVYNLHLSAYSSDGEITNTQQRTLLSDMQSEYEAGNYVIAGGDFNRDLLGDSSEYFNRQSKEATWAKPFPTDFLSDDFTLCAPSNAPSCRDADTAYDPESTFVLSVDGFIVSDNVEVSSCETDDMRFAYSDHNPVRLEFKLLK
jgi:endonuclease/exonuclease/phosphatase family metal-dependent hydrolase